MPDLQGLLLGVRLVDGVGAEGGSDIKVLWFRRKDLPSQRL